MLFSREEAFGFSIKVAAGTRSISDEIVLHAIDKSVLICFKNFLLTFKTAILSRLAGMPFLRKVSRSSACPLFILII
jgi:hypothetical protein